MEINRCTKLSTPLAEDAMDQIVFFFSWLWWWFTADRYRLGLTMICFPQMIYYRILYRWYDFTFWIAKKKAGVVDPNTSLTLLVGAVVIATIILFWIYMYTMPFTPIHPIPLNFNSKIN